MVIGFRCCGNLECVPTLAGFGAESKKKANRIELCKFT